MILYSFYNLEGVDASKYLENDNDLDSIEDVKNGKYSAYELESLRKIARRIIELNNNGKTLSRYEYFLLGGIPFNEALSMIYFIHLDRKFRNLEYASLKKYLSIQVNIKPSKKYDFIIKTHYQFGDYVLTEEEKVNIWNNLLESGIDIKNIDDLVFSGADRAYAMDNGLIKIKSEDSKKLVKRK